MGVHGLWQLLSSTGRPVPLDSLEGKILAVDVSVWLHQLAKGMRDSSGNPVNNAHLHGLFTRICKLLHYRIKPVFVFDGGVPTLKKQTLAVRRSKREGAEENSRAMQQKILTNLIRTQALHEATGVGGRLILPPTQKSKNSKDALFELAPLPEHAQRYLEECKEDPYVESRWELHQAVEEEYFDAGTEAIDVDSEDFTALPAEIQLEIITDLKERKRDYKKMSRFEDLPEESHDFSSFQMKKLLKNNRINTRLETVRHEINSRHARAISSKFYDADRYAADVQAQKLASDDTAHFLLISGIKKKLQQKKLKKAEALSVIPSEESSNPDELLNDSDEDDKVTEVDFLKSTKGKATKLSCTDEDNVVVVEAEDRCLKDVKDGRIVRDVDKPRYRPVIEIDSGSDSKSADELEDRTMSGVVVADTPNQIDVNQLQDGGVMSQSDQDLQMAILMSLEETVPQKSVENSKIANVVKNQVEVSTNDRDINKQKWKKCVARKTKKSSERKDLNGDKFEMVGITNVRQDKKIGSADIEDGSDNAAEVKKRKTRNDQDVSQITKGNKIKKARSILTRRKSSLNDQKDLTQCKDSLTKQEDDDADKSVNQSKNSGIMDKIIDNTSTISKERDEHSKCIKPGRRKTDTGAVRKVKVMEDGVKRTLIESDEDEEKEENEDEEKNEEDEDKENEEEEEYGSDSSSDDFIEVHIDPSNVRPDEMFPASMFDAGDASNDDSNSSAGDSERKVLHITEEVTEVPVGEGAQRKVPEDSDFDDVEVDISDEELQDDTKSDNAGTEDLTNKNVDDVDDRKKDVEIEASVGGDEGVINEEMDVEEDDSDEAGADTGSGKESDGEVAVLEETEVTKDEECQISDKAMIEKPNSPKVPDLMKAFESMNEQSIHGMRAGLAAESKQLRLEQGRQERLATSITDQMHAEAQELLQLFGIPYIVSPTEAEAQCAQLEMSRLVHGTITDDSDIWLFGGQCVFKNFFNQQKHVECFKNQDILDQLGLTRDALINIAMLCGSDYTEGVQSVGPVTAMEILAEFPGLGMECLKSLKNWWVRAAKQLKPSRTETKLRTKLRQLDLPEGFPNKHVVEAYLNPTVDDSSEKFTWTMPDLDLLREFASLKLGWARLKTDEILLPVLKRLNEKDTQRRISSFFQPERYLQPVKMKSKRLQKVVTHFLNPEDTTSQGTDDAQSQSVENTQATSTETAKRKRKKKVDTEDTCKPGDGKKTKNVRNNKAGTTGIRSKRRGNTSTPLEEKKTGGRKATKDLSEKSDLEEVIEDVNEEVANEGTDSSCTIDSDSDSDTSSDSYDSHSDAASDEVDERHVVHRGLDVGEILNLKADLGQLKRQLKAADRKEAAVDKSRVFDSKLNVDEIMNLDVGEELFEEWSDEMPESCEQKQVKDQVEESEVDLKGDTDNSDLKQKVNVDPLDNIELQKVDFQAKSDVNDIDDNDKDQGDQNIPGSRDSRRKAADMIKNIKTSDMVDDVELVGEKKLRQKRKVNFEEDVEILAKRHRKHSVETAGCGDVLVKSNEGIESVKVAESVPSIDSKSTTSVDDAKVSSNDPASGNKNTKAKRTRKKMTGASLVTDEGLGVIKQMVTGVPWADKSRGRKKAGKGKSGGLTLKTEPKESLQRKSQGKVTKKQLIGCVNLSESDSD